MDCFAFLGAQKVQASIGINSIRILVKTSVAKIRNTVSLTVPLDQRVSTLRERVIRLSWVPRDMQYYSVAQKHLRDDAQISKCGIQNNDIVWLHGRLRGGLSASSSEYSTDTAQTARTASECLHDIPFQALTLNEYLDRGSQGNRYLDEMCWTSEPPNGDVPPTHAKLSMPHTTDDWLSSASERTNSADTDAWDLDECPDGDVFAEVKELKEVLKCCTDARFKEVLSALLEMLSRGQRGGALIVIMDRRPNVPLPCKALDDGTLQRAFQRDAKHVLLNRVGFSHLLDALGRHSDGDRFEEANLIRLAHDQNYDSLEQATHIRALLGKPQDGALVVSTAGSLKLAGVKLTPHIEPHMSLKFCGHDGATAGTRHDAALSFCQWMGFNQIDGAVLVRSDNGGVHVMLPSDTAGRPKVFRLAE